MLQLLFTFASTVAGFATGVAVPATYVGIPYLSGDAAYYVSLLVAYGFIIWAVYAITNLLDAVTPQTSWVLYWLSLVSSWFAWVGINITAAIVFYQLVSGGYLHQLSDITGSLQFLLALVGYSWFDVFYLQRRKYVTLLTGAGGAPNPPAPPPPAPAHTTHLGWVVAAMLLIIAIGSAAMFGFGVKVPEGLVAFRKDVAPPAASQAPAPQQPPAPTTTAKAPTTPSAPPVAQRPVMGGWKADINQPLGPEWRDVTNR